MGGFGALTSVGILSPPTRFDAHYSTCSPVPFYLKYTLRLLGASQFSSAFGISTTKLVEIKFLSCVFQFTIASIVPCKQRSKQMSSCSGYTCDYSEAIPVEPIRMNEEINMKKILALQTLSINPALDIFDSTFSLFGCPVHSDRCDSTESVTCTN
jgi:hypothetical protein